MKIAFITNFCPHYREQTFALLARYHAIDYYFFSAGDEWYWQQEHGVRSGDFKSMYLRGFRLGNVRLTPTLPFKLWRGKYDVYLKCINGRFALPAAYLVARLRRKPFILWTGIWMRLQTPAHRMLLPLTRYIYRHADAIVVYGEHIKRYLVSEGVDPERVFIAAHAVDNAQYNRTVSPAEQAALRQKLGVREGDHVILY
ncbi:MAG TPA: glycosyltransferase, partial [Roseiflexaceae bacterium]|nr:glycosyltransferase [Roseiflexaceae bacterium]